jgi:uncharacterized protein
MKLKINCWLFLLCFISTSSFAEQDTAGVSFQSGKYIMIPANRKTKMPAIIFLPGSGGNSSYSSNYADFLKFFLEASLPGESMVLLYFDKRGVGQSEGIWYKTDFKERAFDAKNAAEYLKTLPFIDPEQIFLVGHSQGGWIVQLCLAEYPDTFAGGISMAGATFGVKQQLINDYHSKNICSGNMTNEKAYKKAQKQVARILFFTTMFPVKPQWKQLKRIRNYENDEYLKKIQKPILYMWGENDQLVSPQSCMNRLNKVFSNAIPANFETYIGNGENHSFKKSPFCYTGKSKDLFYSDDSRKKLVTWLTSRLKNR